MKRVHMLDLDTLTLAHGVHKEREQGLCLMEAVAYFAGLPHSDHPKCSSPVLTEFGIRINDRMNEIERQRLKPFIPRLVGTNDPAKEQVRYRILCWAAITEFAPAALRLVKDEKCQAFAERLEGLPRYDWGAAKRIGYEARDCARKVRRVRWNAAADAADADADAAADAAADATADAAYAAYAAAADADADAAAATDAAADAADAAATAFAAAADAAYAATDAAAAAYAAYAAATAATDATAYAATDAATAAAAYATAAARTSIQTLCADFCRNRLVVPEEL